MAAAALERPPLRWLTWWRVAVACVAVFLLALAAKQVLSGPGSNRVIVVCTANRPAPATSYETEWQWLSPGWVCVYDDGTRHHVGL